MNVRMVRVACLLSIVYGRYNVPKRERERERLIYMMAGRKYGNGNGCNCH